MIIKLPDAPPRHDVGWARSVKLEIEKGFNRIFEYARLPAGGSKGAVLSKASSRDYDTQWGTSAGTFTPVVSGGTTAGSPTYTVQGGVYSRIGNVVHFNMDLRISAVGGMVGILKFDGLPLAGISTANGNTSYQFCSGAEIGGVTAVANTVGYLSYIAASSTTLLIEQLGNTGALGIVTASQISAGATFLISGSYLVDP